MALIALEEHVIPTDLVDRVWASRSAPEKIRTALGDVGEQRLRVMDDNGIDMQVLSVAPPGAQEVAAEESVTLARALNDRVAAAVTAHPDRFQALASLPTPDPEAAAVEAKRAVSELGFRGLVINGHTGGRFLDQPEYDALLGTIEELGVPLYLHPTYPPPQVAEIYFGGLEAPVAERLATAAWGWHAETGLHVLRLAVNGVFERHPGLRVVVGHMGENLPFSLMRADAMLAVARRGKRRWLRPGSVVRPCGRCWLGTQRAAAGPPATVLVASYWKFGKLMRRCGCAPRGNRPSGGSRLTWRCGCSSWRATPASCWSSSRTATLTCSSWVRGPAAHCGGCWVVQWLPTARHKLNAAYSRCRLRR